MPSTKTILFASASAAALALVVAPQPSFAQGEEPAMTPPGVTEYYGVRESTDTPAWAAEATMNPDYAGAAPVAPEGASSETTQPAASDDAKSAEDAEAAAKAAAEAEEAKKKAEEEAAAAAKAAEEAAAKAAAEAEEAKKKAEEEAAAAAKAAAEAEAKKKAEEEAAAAAKAAEEAKRQQAVEACRDSLNAEALIGKLTFASGKWDVLPKSYGALDKIAQVAKDCGDLVIEIGGHTDNIGDSASNVTISQLRAQSILKYLTRAGVDAAKLRAVGHGDSNPVADNASAEGRQKNRRIEFSAY